MQLWMVRFMFLMCPEAIFSGSMSTLHLCRLFELAQLVVGQRNTTQACGVAVSVGVVDAGLRSAWTQNEQG